MPETENPSRDNNSRSHPHRAARTSPASRTCQSRPNLRSGHRSARSLPEGMRNQYYGICCRSQFARQRRGHKGNPGGASARRNLRSRFSRSPGTCSGMARRPHNSMVERRRPERIRTSHHFRLRSSRGSNRLRACLRGMRRPRRLGRCARSHRRRDDESVAARYRCRLGPRSGTRHRRPEFFSLPHHRLKPHRRHRKDSRHGRAWSSPPHRCLGNELISAFLVTKSPPLPRPTGNCENDLESQSN